MECSSEDDCAAGGACFGGLDDLRVCLSDNDCRGGVCQRCRPVGGDGCAANCTFENRIEVGLVYAQIAPSQDEIVLGTSGAVIFGPFLTIPLPFIGSLTLTVGGAIDGISPVVIKTSDLDLAAIPAGTAACACIRAATQFTCGGTVLEANGRSSANCTPNVPGTTTCPAESGCAPVH